MAGNPDDELSIITGGSEGDSQDSPTEDNNDNENIEEPSIENDSNNNEDENNGSSNEGEEITEQEPSLYVVEDRSKDKTFQARVFHEKDKQVYGAEVILFDSDAKVIDKILITNKTDFDAYTNLVDNMRKAYPPFTQKDYNNLDILSRLASGQIDETSEEYKNMSWSTLHDIQFLDEILKNINQIIEINATKLNGFSSDEFAKSYEVPDINKYLSKSEHYSDTYKLPATTQRYGHSLIVDNLNATELINGEVLSARQGGVLKGKINDVDKKVNDFSWSKTKTKGNYIKYWVNPGLRLITMVYRRPNYKGFKSKTGMTIAHKGAIPKQYRPKSVVVAPLFRSDFSLHIEPTGDIHYYNLTKKDEIDIYLQVMWYY